MTLTLDALIYSTKTKRWFHVLGLLEDQQSITAQILADKIGCSERTIRTDIKEIKHYFSSSITLSGNEEGYHFSFQDPPRYVEKKQALLEKEPMFLFLDQLLEGKRKTNQEWAQTLAMAPASFGRLKRRVSQLLEERYSLAIRSMDNRIYGEETAIRQFMYEFSFTLPLYPPAFEKKLTPLPAFNDAHHLETWQVDPLLLNQWYHVFQWRIAYGNSLPVNAEVVKLQAKLIAALDASCLIALPAQEEGMQMTPNSHFNFPISLNSDRFQARDYVLKLTVTSGEEEWSWEQHFIVDADEARPLKREDVMIDTSTNWWGDWPNYLSYPYT